jgi:hypothetical protein
MTIKNAELDAENQKLVVDPSDKPNSSKIFVLKDEVDFLKVLSVVKDLKNN